jgi:hypothetical protein
MFSVRGGQFLAKGKETRYADAAPEIRAQVQDYCRRELAGGDYPAARWYPDLA